MSLKGILRSGVDAANDRVTGRNDYQTSKREKITILVTFLR